MIGHYYNENAWKDTDNSILRWSMNYDESFELRVKLDTTNGSRYIVYSPYNTSTGLSGVKIYQGLGATARNGKWQTFTRDLQADLQEYDSNSSILAVNAFLVRGSGKIDDIELLNTMPPPEPVPEYIVYEDAESTTTDNWEIYDETPEGATISNVYDADKQSNVIVFNGTQRENGYRIGQNSISSPRTWNNTDHKFIRWSMNYTEKYSVFVSLQTTKGHRYVYYTEKDTDTGLSSSGTYIHQGLGASTIDGTWQTFTRDLEADLQEYDSNNSILTVNGFLVRGSGMVDDIVMVDNNDTVIPVIPVETQVNTETVSNQNYSAITGLNDGGYIISWTSSGVDGIYTQRYTSDGEKFGGETTVITENDYPYVELPAPYDSSITGLTDGGYVITWSSDTGNPYLNDIYTKSYEPDGSLKTSVTRVNTTNVNQQVDSSVTALSDGDYVVSWTSYDTDKKFGVFARHYDSNGVVDINVSDESNHQYKSSITALADGGFVVVWQSNEGGSGYEIHTQRYDSSGTADASGVVKVNTTTGGDQTLPSITTLYDSEAIYAGYAVSWTSGNDIYTQRYDLNNTVIGNETLVNSYTTDIQDDSSITGLKNGGYVVSWTSEGQDTDGSGIYIQRFDANGATAGNEILVNSTTKRNQSHSSITALGNGGFIVVWQSQEKNYSDRYDIYAQRYDANGNRVGGMTND